MTCIINGCRLVIPPEGKSLWGDLHQLYDGTWVFNGCLDAQSSAWNDPLWEYASDADATEKQLIGIGPYFERRGVVTIPATSGEYNAAAKEYLP